MFLKPNRSFSFFQNSLSDFCSGAPEGVVSFGFHYYSFSLKITHLKIRSQICILTYYKNQIHNVMRIFTKFIYWIFLIPLFSGFSGCITETAVPGPRGDQGPQGPQGPAGPVTVALMYEIQFDLDASNNWQQFFDFPAEDEIFLEDVVLVYRLEPPAQGSEGPDVWRLMPIHYFYPEGVLELNYDFTVNDVRIYAKANFVLDNTLDARYDEVMRIVVVPAGFSPNARVNYENYHEVIASLGITDYPAERKKTLKNSIKRIQ